MDEQAVRKIVHEELLAQAYNSGSPIVPIHNHDGNNSPKVNEKNLLAGIRFNGTIDMKQNAIYTLPITGIPKNIDFYGGALGGGNHAMIVGNAKLGGTNLQWQPGTSTSVTTNGINEGIMQGCGTLVVGSGFLGTASTLGLSTNSFAYTFTVTSANATVGATYTNNGQTFTITGTIAGGTTLSTIGTGIPAASGTLTKASGTGDATIAFSKYVVISNDNLTGSNSTIGTNSVYLCNSQGHIALVLDSTLTNVLALAQIVSYSSTEIKIQVILNSPYTKISGLWIVT